MTVVDNSDGVTAAGEARAIAGELGAEYLATPANLGWGASINFWLSQASDPKPLTLIAAHDARLERFGVDDIMHALSCKEVFAVSPENGRNTVCRYSHARFFYFTQRVPERLAYEVPVGHSTAILFKTQKIKSMRFDEEFFIYGCESEIFIRAKDVGLKTYQSPSFQVRNPSTDSEQGLVSTAFLVNSLYCAHKHGGVLGLISRSLRMILSTAKDARLEKIGIVLWAWKNLGKGFRTYRSTRVGQSN